MTNPCQLLVEYELGIAKDAQLIEWAREALSGNDAIARDQVLVKLAALSSQFRPEAEMAGEYFRELIERHFSEFSIQSSEGGRLARGILRRRCEHYIQGHLTPYELCLVVSPIEQHFDYPTWLGNLYNACDWVEPSTRREEVPHLLEEAKRAYETA
jgi:hypothetical protein